MSNTYRRLQAKKNKKFYKISVNDFLTAMSMCKEALEKEPLKFDLYYKAGKEFQSDAPVIKLLKGWIADSDPQLSSSDVDYHTYAIAGAMHLNMVGVHIGNI